MGWGYELRAAAAVRHDVEAARALLGSESFNRLQTFSDYFDGWLAKETTRAAIEAFKQLQTLLQPDLFDDWHDKDEETEPPVTDLHALPARGRTRRGANADTKAKLQNLYDLREQALAEGRPVPLFTAACGLVGITWDTAQKWIPKRFRRSWAQSVHWEYSEFSEFYELEYAEFSELRNDEA